MIALTAKEIATEIVNSYFFMSVPIDTENGPVEAVRRVAIDTVAEKIKEILNLDDNATTEDVSNAIKSLKENELSKLIKNVEFTDNKMILTYYDDSTTETDVEIGGGLSFSTGKMDEQGYLHLVDAEGNDIQGFTPFFVGNGGGGSSDGSQMVFAVLSGMNTAVTDNIEYVPIRIKFTSVIIGTNPAVDTGAGTLQIYINDNLSKTLSIAQGETDLAVQKLIPVNALKNDSNKVKLVVTDSYGLSTTRTVTVTKVNLSIAWDLASDTVKNSERSFIVNITPTGAAGTTKTITLNVTGPNGYNETFTRNTVISGSSAISFILDSLVDGAYILNAECSMDYAGYHIDSNVLRGAVAQITDGKNCVIASPFNQTNGVQFTTIPIRYRVINGNNESADVTLTAYDENNEVKFTQEINVDASEQVWNYKPTSAGTNKLVISCGTTTWEHSIVIDALSIKAEEVTNYLDYKLEPAKLSSIDSFILSPKFDSVNGGLSTDDEGIPCIKVIKGDRLTIPYNLFGTSADANGKEFKIVYKVENCTNINTTAIECVSNGIGVTVKANSVEMNTALTALDLITCEKIKTEIDVNITNKQNNRLITIWEKGRPHKVIQYASNNDKVNQDEPVGITVGSDDCTVLLYLIRSYSKALSDSEIISNFIVDGKDGDEIVARDNRNTIYNNGELDEAGNAVADVTGSLDTEFIAQKNINAHIFTISAPAFPKGKASSDYVSGQVNYELRSGGQARKFARPINMRFRLQGTSSLDYVDSAGNVDIQFRENIIWADGHEQPKFKISNLSIPVDYINIKVNDASSEHINNIILAYWFNMHQPWLRPVRVNNSSVRDTVEGDMCIFFYHNSGTSSVKAGSTFVEPGDTILYALGNVNNSKKNNEVFGQDDDDDILCVEVNNNIDDKCRFKEGNVTAADFGDESPFGIRYISSTLTENGDTEEEAAAKLFAPFQQFIVDCDPKQATGEELEEVVTYKVNKSGKTQIFTHDTEAYRIAKFRNELSNYFVVETGQYHYLFTLFFCMVDNRSKNVFFGYSKKTGKWHLCFGYDFDTSMGINNVGALSLSYGYIDTDHIGHNERAGYVYNAYDSAFWDLIRLAFPEENADLYLELETSGCWDMNAFANLCDEYQSKFCEALWAEDFRRKYINPLINLSNDTFLDMGQGPKALQRRNFLMFQEAFISSFFVSNFCKDHQAFFRSYGTADKMVITPYSDMYVVFIGGNYKVQKRAYAGVPVEIDISDFKANDIETHICNAPFIMDIGDMSELKMATCHFADFERVKSIIVGSPNSDYENSQLKSLDVKNCVGLETLVVANCPNLADKELDLSNNVSLDYLDIRGTGVSAITFANGGRISKAYLNAVGSITAKNLQRLEILQFSTDNLNYITVENVSYEGMGDVLVSAFSLKNVRAVNVNLVLTNSSLLKRLQSIKGYDADNNETEKAVISGNCYISGISSTVFANMKKMYPDLKITYGKLLPEYSVKFMANGELFEEQIVEEGGAAIAPTETPTKPSTVSTEYLFAGWSPSFANITKDVEIEAVFEERTRRYTVTFMNGLVPVQTEIVEYNESCKYNGDDLYVPGTLYGGWQDKDTGEVYSDGIINNVAKDTILNAYYIQPVLPPQKLTEYQYIASTDPNDYIPNESGVTPAAYTWSQLCAICLSGLQKDYITLKDRIKVVPVSRDVLKDDTIEFMLVSYNHCRLAEDETALAGTVWQAVGVLNATRAMNSTNTNVGGYEASAMAKWLDTTFLKQLPPIVRSVIKAVRIKTTIGDQSQQIQWGTHKVWLPSTIETNLGSGIPYINEYDELSESRGFSVYPDNNSRIKKTFNGLGSAANWWLRSPYATSSTQFCYVFGSGTLINYGAGIGDSVSPCFCI